MEHASLRSLTRRANELQAEIEEFEREIARLEAERAPLILDPGGIRKVGNSCTGSMEPVVTCLDKTLWLYDFDPTNIVVGSTISFDPGCNEEEGKTDGRYTAHRVMEIKVEGGVHYYWPKGDASLVPDGCWIPEQHVSGYVVGIEKNVVPANAKLRDAVNGAKAAWLSARAAHYDVYIRHCGFRRTALHTAIASGAGRGMGSVV